MMATILNSAILVSANLHKTLTQTSQSDSNSFILTQLDDGSHLEFCHHGFSHFAERYFTHSFWLNLMMAAILNSAMLDSDTALLDSDTLFSSLRFTQKHSPLWLCLKLFQSDSNTFILTQLDDGSHDDLHSAILVFPLKLTHTCQDWFPLFASRNLDSFILTQLDDCSYLEICHPCFSHFAHKNFTHWFWLNLMMAAILKSTMLDSDPAILDSDTSLTSLRFTQKHSHSILTLTQTNQSDSNSFILI